MHFGHCEKFVVMDADPQANRVVRQEEVDAPEHEPGLLPRWLKEKYVAGARRPRQRCYTIEDESA